MIYRITGPGLRHDDRPLLLNLEHAPAVGSTVVYGGLSYVVDDVIYELLNVSRNPDDDPFVRVEKAEIVVAREVVRHGDTYMRLPKVWDSPPTR